MTRELTHLLVIGTFLVGTLLLAQSEVPAAGFNSPAAATSAATMTTANTTTVGAIACVCSCGINCDGSCAYDVGSCIYVGDAINCVGNCCAGAPKPGRDECAYQ